MTTTIASGIRVPDLLGTNETRIDGRSKVSGRAKYAADYAREGMLWAAFVSSPYPHARIVRIDTAAALASAGVHAVLTGADIGERYMGTVLKDWPVLALGVARFVGEYVAVVAAETRATAEAAAALVDVTYEELAPFLDPEASIAPGAPLFHGVERDFHFNGPKRPARPHPNMQGYERVEKADPDAAFAAAPQVFEHTYFTPRYHAGYIEPRATLVWIDAAGAYHVIATNKMPFGQRDQLAHATGLPKERIVIEPCYIGGEFGAKAMTLEEFPLYYVALATGRPVKHIRTHADDVRSTAVRHASKVTVKIAHDADGTFRALDVRVLFDGGAYGAVKTGPNVLPGRVPKFPYRLPSARVERIAAYTNTVPGAFVRAPGDFQITFAVESAVDMLARELGIDPLELRLRNAAYDGDTDAEGNPFREPRGRLILGTLREAMGWDEPAQSGRGRGVALTARTIGGGKTALVATAHAGGRIDVTTAACEPGVGTHTVIRRVIAGELGIDPEHVFVERASTADAPFDPGIGGSRGTLLLGQAALDAARKLKAALDEGVPLPVRVDGAYEHAHRHGDPVPLNFGGYGAEVSVDRETGRLTIHEIVFVADVGTVINPVAHRGQIDGGFLMGLGHALTEELFVENGRLLNVPLSEYKLPTQADMPPFRVIQLEQRRDGPGPFGALAAGEFNIAGVAPAITNAIADAIGVRVERLSVSAERLHAALNAPATA